MGGEDAIVDRSSLPSVHEKFSGGLDDGLGSNPDLESTTMAKIFNQVADLLRKHEQARSQRSNMKPSLDCRMHSFFLRVGSAMESRLQGFGHPPGYANLVMGTFRALNRLAGYLSTEELEPGDPEACSPKSDLSLGTRAEKKLAQQI